MFFEMQLNEFEFGQRLLLHQALEVKLNLHVPYNIGNDDLHHAHDLHVQRFAYDVNEMCGLNECYVQNVQKFLTKAHA